MGLLFGGCCGRDRLFNWRRRRGRFRNNFGFLLHDRLNWR